MHSERVAVDAVLSSVMSYVEKATSHALSPMDKNSLAVENQAKEMTERIRNEIGKLRGDILDLNRISDMEDHIDFLQVRRTVFVLAGCHCL